MVIFLKKRLDVILYEKGYYESRERAKTSIMAGLVYVDGKLKDKPGEKVDEEVTISIKGNAIPYVSRGGLKLEKAFKVFPFDVKEKIVADIGASTGGFTDCLLQNGAKKVYSIDVGYGQLAWKLRQDPRVTCMERTNFRHMTRDDFGERLERATIDVSFISLSIILKTLYDLLEEDGEVVALIKPQFEAGRDKVGKKGVVSDPKVHIQVIRDVIEKISEIGFYVKGLTYSPITGPEGNIEFLIYIGKSNNQSWGKLEMESIIQNVVQQAHASLK